MVDAQRLGRLAFTHYQPTSVCPQAYLCPYLAAPNAVGPPPRPTAPPPHAHTHTSMGQTIVSHEGCWQYQRFQLTCQPAF